MGILNVTPDSFSDGGHYTDVDKAVEHAIGMVRDGADVIDVGGESTRPGAKPISLEEELSRVIPVIEKLSKKIDVPISIDTYKAEVARQAVEAGATIINDVWAGKKDQDMYRVMGNSNTSVILMHNRVSTMENDDAENILEEVMDELKDVIQLAIEAGVKKKNIIIDPGIGFAKTLSQNIEIIKNIDELKKLGYPVLLAASKKRTIRGLSQTEELSRLGAGTLATTCYAYTKGVDFVRVHDVAENKIAITVLKNLTEVR